MIMVLLSTSTVEIVSGKSDVLSLLWNMSDSFITPGFDQIFNLRLRRDMLIHIRNNLQLQNVAHRTLICKTSECRRVFNKFLCTNEMVRRNVRQMSSTANTYVRNSKSGISNCDVTCCKPGMAHSFKYPTTSRTWERDVTIPRPLIA